MARIKGVDIPNNKRIEIHLWNRKKFIKTYSKRC